MVVVIADVIIPISHGLSEDSGNYLKVSSQDIAIDIDR